MNMTKGKKRRNGIQKLNDLRFKTNERQKIFNETVKFAPCLRKKKKVFLKWIDQLYST